MTATTLQPVATYTGGFTMTRPKRYLAWMGVGLAALLLLVVVLFPRIHDAFLNNPGLNSGILLVMLIGIGFTFWQVLRLYPEVDWLERFQRGEPDKAEARPPKLLAALAAMLGERKGRLSLSTLTVRSLLDGVNSRLDESHDISRYLIGLLIFLGLLGTFWGLLGTIRGVADAIAEITVVGTDPATMFETLRSGIQAPLSGMGTAFSASLFGLSGSLVVGYLELQAGQAQNRFYNELEDWLAGQTRVASATSTGEAEGSVPAYIQALLEQTADSLENLQRTMMRTEDSRIQANNTLKVLTDRLSALADQRRLEAQLMLKLSENQSELRPWLTRMAELAQQGSFGIDEASRHHLRNIDIYLGRLLEETANAREYTVKELRSEIKLLARTIAAVAEGER